MENTNSDIQQILERNRRVEADKAWETSWTRRLFIASVTYITAVVFLRLIDTPDAPINALVPTGGFLLSTLSLPWLKSRWLKNRS